MSVCHLIPLESLVFQDTKTRNTSVKVMEIQDIYNNRFECVIPIPPPDTSHITTCTYDYHHHRSIWPPSLYFCNLPKQSHVLFHSAIESMSLWGKVVDNNNQNVMKLTLISIEYKLKITHNVFVSFS